MSHDIPLAALLEVYRDGDERGWQTEFDRLWSEQPARMDYLTTSIQETGIRTPILLGTDGRVWDGHHRLAVAQRLGFERVPVEFAGEPESWHCSRCGTDCERHRPATPDTPPEEPKQ